MNNHYPHLSKAPISEALLDLRVELPADIPLSTIAAFAESVRGEFPQERTLEEHRFQIHPVVGGGDTQPVVSSAFGKIFWTHERDRAVQARLNGFAFNWIKSYENWEALRKQAQPIWASYVRVMRPSRVIRCALRYINRINVEPAVDLANYFRTLPLMSKELPQTLQSFFLRTVVPFGDNHKAILTQATQEDDRRTIIFDIDAHTENELSLDPNSEQVWVELEALREIKNKAFFGSLTRETWEAYR